MSPGPSTVDLKLITLFVRRQKLQIDSKSSDPSDESKTSQYAGTATERPSSENPIDCQD